MRGTTAAVIAAMIVAASVTPARSAQAAPGFEVVPGEFLVRNPGVVMSDMEALSDGWYLIHDATVEFANGRAAALSRDLAALVIPNRVVQLASDPLVSDQWALENTGQTGGTVDADIDADAAWAFTEGNPSVVVAVIDTGVDLDHPDLAGRLWINAGEIPGNGVDDDQNGYIDDVNGWDFSASDNSPDDEYGHGTAVAGMAAADLNGVGTVGIAPQITIMPLRACSPGCPISTLVAAVAYARNNGADIINMSLGGTGPYFDPLRDELTASPDVLVTAAAGNTASNSDPNPFFPAGFGLPNILSVASTDDSDQLSGFSNFGEVTVDLAAPGENVLTTSIGGWANASGTSFSSPLVAGVAGLVLSLRPGSPPEEVIDLILAGVDSLPSLTGKTKTGGRLNAGATVFAATGPVASISLSTTDATVPATVTLD
ncbi:MAG: S8 family serine peptidase, partial [Acidimicrobiia bacterium]|nr:S8 family serine peptidase [Acidimicrobiia bacterium]